jgi:hypothetical protein
MDPSLDEESKHQVRKDRLNTRKKALTAESSARWANAIIAANDDQYRLSRDAQQRHIVGLRAAIATLEKRLAQPANDTLTPEQRKAHKNTRLPKGYQSQAERFAKQRRLQVLRAGLARAEADRDSRRVHVVEGGKRLAKTRHHLEVADLTLPEWRQRWNCARYRIEAKGSGDEPFGNLTITVTPAGEVSLRLPKPLERLANAKHSRYILSGTAVFSYRADEWLARITGGNPWPTPSVVNPGERVVTSQPRGRRRQTPRCRTRTRHSTARKTPDRRCGSQRRAPRGAAPRRPRQPCWSTSTNRRRCLG